MKRTLLTILLISSIGWDYEGLAQCASADFSLSTSSCLNQNLPIKNLTGAGAYYWDFCSGDLNTTPTAQNLYEIPQTDGRPGMEFAKDGNQWFAFITGTSSNVIFRLRFGNGLANAPSLIENLGDLGGMLQSPGQVRVISENNQWYGLVHNTATGELLKLSFGNSLANSFTTSALATGLGYSNSGLAVGKDPVHGWVCLISVTGAKFALLRLGNSISSPGPSDVLITTSFGVSPGFGDVDLINVCGNWIGYSTADLGGSNVYRLNFGTSLFSDPAITSIATVVPSNLGRARMARDGEEYFLFITSFDGLFQKLNFGNDPYSLPLVTNEGNIGGAIPGNLYGLAIAKEASEWTIITTSQGTGKAFHIYYPNTCSASTLVSTQVEPLISYNQPGNYDVTLEYLSAAGTSYKTRSVSVSSFAPPDIDFSSQNYCVNNSVDFTTINNSGNLSTYAWAFGDGGISSTANPSHTFTSTGDYVVELILAASNGCTNYTQKSLHIFNIPVASFTLPSTSPICTNQNYLVPNLTSFDPGSNPTWEWRLNGALVSNQLNFTTLFNSPVAQEIRLKALIPGCSNEVIKTISTVTTGPVVNFSAPDNCRGTSVSFINSTTGADAGYLWSFGDASSSSATSPAHTYSSSAVFQATLTASNSAGCQNFLTKPIKIYSLPVPDFSVGLPPFSCSNSLTPFQNNTPPLTDSNITSWSWQFNDVSGGTSSQQNPGYTFTTSGNFNVALTATSNAGCSASITKSIAIAPSPSANFSQGPACLNQSAVFTDTSSGGVQSRLWQIGSSSFSTPNPTYAFTSTGDFIVTLSVTNVNACSSVKSKTIKVPVPPTLNFSVANLCATKNAVFSDVTSTPLDGITGWNWNFAGNSMTGNPAENNFGPAGTYNVKMTTTHASGCKYTLSRNVLINPSPTASFTASPDRGAAPLTVKFTNTSQQATGYVWKFNDKLVSTSTATSPVYTFASLGDYSAEVTARNAQGCLDVLSVPIHVLVPSIDLIMKDFSLVSDPATGKLKTSVTILNNSNVPIGSAEVALFLSDKAVVNQTLSLNLNPGQFAVRTLSFTLSPNQFNFSFLCAEVISEKDVQPDNNKRCLNLETADYFFSPYPNPSSGTLQLDWIAEKSGGTTRIIVYDGMGKKSYEWQTASLAGLNQTIHDLTFLSSGLYYVTIENGSSRKTIRFLRQ